MVSGFIKKYCCEGLANSKFRAGVKNYLRIKYLVFILVLWSKSILSVRWHLLKRNEFQTLTKFQWIKFILRPSLYPPRVTIFIACFLLIPTFYDHCFPLWKIIFVVPLILVHHVKQQNFTIMWNQKQFMLKPKSFWKCSI